MEIKTINYAQPINPLTFGPTLVVAPHPDDESLGCGGTIVRLRQAEVAVFALMVSDGSASHPNSMRYPAHRLQQVGEAEALDALTVLGVSTEAVTFMRQPDSRVVTPGQPGFDDAVAVVTKLLTRIKPTTVLVPWRRDPHRDHRATWQLMDTALDRLPERPRRLEYFVWLWELAQPADWPQPGEVQTWRVNITSVLNLKNGLLLLMSHR